MSLEEALTVQNNIHIAAMAIIFVLNITEICLIYNRRRSIKTYDKLILGLAISDIITATAIAIHVVSKSKNLTILTSISVYINFFSNIVADLSVALITVDRLVAVRFPLKRLTFPSTKQVNISIAVIWLLGVASTAIYFYNNYKHGHVQTNFYEFIYYYQKPISYFLSSLCIMLILGYTYILIVTIKRGKATISTTSRAGNVAAAREKAIVVTSALVIGAFLICNAPFVISVCLSDEVNRVTSSILFFNGALNPLVYFFKKYFERRYQQRAQ
eukprot:gene16026-17647_t